jgi:hypothetical protein
MRRCLRNGGEGCAQGSVRQGLVIVDVENYGGDVRGPLTPAPPARRAPRRRRRGLAREAAALGAPPRTFRAPERGGGRTGRYKWRARRSCPRGSALRATATSLVRLAAPDPDGDLVQHSAGALASAHAVPPVCDRAGVVRARRPLCGASTAPTEADCAKRHAARPGGGAGLGCPQPACGQVLGCLLGRGRARHSA